MQLFALKYSRDRLFESADAIRKGDTPFWDVAQNDGHVDDGLAKEKREFLKKIEALKNTYQQPKSRQMQQNAPHIMTH